MSQPTLHSQSAGVHPGAFVQPTAPDTSAVQDGVLWVDTSVPPPYPLRTWNQAHAQWQEVGTALPGASEGSIIYQRAGTWHTLSIGRPGEELSVVPVGSALEPRWQPCCGADVLSKTPPTVPAVSGPLRASRCGAAVAMAEWLEQYYQNTWQFIDYALTGLVSFTIDALLAGLTAALTDGAGLPLIAARQPAILALARWLLKKLRITTFSALGLTENNTILETAYQALPSAANSYTITQDVIQQWEALLAANSGVFHGTNLGLLLRLIEIPNLDTWQQLAYRGSLNHSTLCKDFVDIGGKSIKGGAFFGNVPGKSLTGGALIGTLTASMQGGASISNTNRRALTGGATSS